MYSGGGRKIKYRRSKSRSGFLKRLFGRDNSYPEMRSWSLNPKPRGLGLKRIIVAGLALAALLAAFTAWQLQRRSGAVPSASNPREVNSQTAGPAASSKKTQFLTKAALANIIGSRLLEPKIDPFEVIGPNGQPLYIHTTLDHNLQDWAVKSVNKSGALKCAVVGLNPGTGEVLAIADHQADATDGHAALKGGFPAASLFKIIVAAGVVEKNDLTGSSSISFDGGKHTLYKNQVNKPIDQGANKNSLRESFAQSINASFGKLGAHVMGAEGLTEFASVFRFNQALNFDMPVENSQFMIAEDAESMEYQLAEIASGFNRSTTISPLHAAMISAASVNGGYLLEPWVVKEVFDKDGNLYYQGKINNLGPAISPQTAAELSSMMMAAILEGTARRTFHDSGTHPVLSKLILGGKSGTLNNDQEQKVDWFVAWARPIGDNDPKNAFAVSALVVHEGLTTVTSQELARAAIINYFQNRLK